MQTEYHDPYLKLQEFLVLWQRMFWKQEFIACLSTTRKFYLINIFYNTCICDIHHVSWLKFLYQLNNYLNFLSNSYPANSLHQLNTLSHFFSSHCTPDMSCVSLRVRESLLSNKVQSFVYGIFTMAFFFKKNKVSLER